MSNVDLRQKLIDDAKKRSVQIVNDAKSAAFKNVQPAKQEAERIIAQAQQDAERLKKQIVEKSVPLLQKELELNLMQYIENQASKIVEQAVSELWDKRMDLVLRYALLQLKSIKGEFVFVISSDKKQELEAQLPRDKQVSVKSAGQKGIFYVSVDNGREILDFGKDALIEEFKAKVMPDLINKINREALK